MLRSMALRRGRRATPLVALLAMAMVATACGDDDDGGDASATTAGGDTATTAAGTDTTEGSGEEATGDPVTIVALIDETGPSPSSPGSREVVQATAEAINDEGGLAGHPIEVQFIDTRGDSAVSEEAVREISDAIAVVMSSPSTESAIADSLSEVGVPVVGVGYNPGVWGATINAFNLSCESSPEFCAKPNFLTITTTSDAVVVEQIIGAEAAGATTVSFAACAEVDSCAAAAPIFEAAAAEFGLQSVEGARVSSTAADYTAECIEFIQNGVDFIQISATASVGVRLIESCLDQGYEGIFGASAGSVDRTLLAAPGTLAGGLNAFPWFVDDEPVVEYRELMDAAGLEEELYSHPVGTGLYSAMRLLQAGINDHADPAAPLDGAAALAAMYQVQDEDLGGLIAPVSFSEDDLDRNRPCFWPYIKDAEGNLENPLGGLNFQCYPEQ